MASMVHIEKGEYIAGDNNGKRVDLCVSIQDPRIGLEDCFLSFWMVL
jgi:hypothetical protein